MFDLEVNRFSGGVTNYHRQGNTHTEKLNKNHEVQGNYIQRLDEETNK